MIKINGIRPIETGMVIAVNPRTLLATQLRGDDYLYYTVIHADRDCEDIEVTAAGTQGGSRTNLYRSDLVEDGYAIMTQAEFQQLWAEQHRDQGSDEADTDNLEQEIEEAYRRRHEPDESLDEFQCALLRSGLESFMAQHASTEQKKEEIAG